MSKIYKSFGSIEGVFKFCGTSFKIYDALRGDSVECIFKGKDVEFSDILNKRVCLNGEIKSMENGKRLNIIVDNFEVFLPENELTNVDEIIGILK